MPLLTVVRPCFREAVIGNIIALDAERVLDDLGGMIGVVGVDCSRLVMACTPRFIFALMDSDGDGTVSLQEFQAAHEKIFKAMDTDKDGTLTIEEIQAFMRGKSAPKEHEHE